MPPKQIKRSDIAGLFWMSGAAMGERDCAALIGSIAMEWQNAIQELSVWYAYFILGPREFGDRQRLTLIEALDTIRSFRMKRKLLLEAASSRFAPSLIDDFKVYLNALQDAGGERDKLVHGRWYLSPEYHDCLVLDDPKDEQFYSLYDGAALAEVHDQLIAASVNLGSFYDSRMKVALEPAT